MVVGNLFDGCAVHFAVECNDAAECAGGVGGVGEFVGGQCIGWAPPSWAAFSKAVPKLNQLTDDVVQRGFTAEKE